MILNDAQINQIVDEVLVRTGDGQLRWFCEDDHLLAELPNQTTVEVAQGQDTDVVVSLKSASGIVYGQMKAPKTPESAVAKLYTLAHQHAGKSIFADIMDSLKLSGSATVEVVQAAPRVSPEQAVEVLQRMKGSWNLDFTSGKEHARISADGDYFRNGGKDPAFRLKVLAWNESKSSAEVAKDWPDGRRLQIESLTIARDTMTGYAKHDGHKLSYTRTEA
ncbi:MAG TPA: hypothetical protein VFI31_19705 [Pirellulales bacterium]|nr:hypothetical protein [Pirellulales bacterium]